MDPRFYHKSFSALSTEELYDLMVLRQEVFIVEQNCAYQDADGTDLNCDHVLAYDDALQLIGCARIVPKGVKYEGYASIGRVISKGTKRGTGLGKKVMQYAMNACLKQYPQTPIKISAQVVVQGFYENLGFVAVGEAYMEDDIPHIGMIFLPKC